MSAQPGHITIPERLTETVQALEGEPGRAWLAELPDRYAAYLDRWQLTLERIAEPGGPISLIGYVHRNDDLSPAVLKAGVVNPETAQEHAALRRWAGRGAVLLLEADPPAGMLLLERLHGDIPLRSLAEAKAMLEAAGLLQRLWVPVAEGHPFTLVRDRIAEQLPALREATAPAGADELVAEAVAAAERLIGSEPERFLLHGDFHHGNVLAADRAPWLAIDPKPLVGERAYDLAWLVQDRMDTLAGSPGPAGAVRRRLHQLSEAVEVDPARLRDWTLYRTVRAGLTTADAPTAELYLEFASWL